MIQFRINLFPAFFLKHFKIKSMDKFKNEIPKIDIINTKEVQKYYKYKFP